jgi:hypothetical protein
MLVEVRVLYIFIYRAAVTLVAEGLDVSGPRATSDKEEPGGHAMAPPGSRTLYCAKLTLSSSATRREESLFTSPVRIAVVSRVVGDWLPTTPAGCDRIDLRVGSGSGVVDIGYPLTGR